MNLARMGFILPAVLCALVATVSRANEDTKSNPYESIAARNPFQLKDPPPLPDPNDVPKAPAPPLATVEVTGLLNLGKKKVLLEIVPGPGKPPDKKTLEEGERIDAIEVLFIDVDNNEVKINNGGVITNLALKAPTKAPSGPAVPVPGVQPGFPAAIAPPPTAGIVPPTVNPGVPNANGTYNNARNNVMVVGGSPAAPTATAGSGVMAKPSYGSPGAVGAPTYGTPTYNAGSGVNVTGGGAGAPGGVNVSGGGELPRTIPTRPIRTNPQSTGAPDAALNDPAAQYLNMAIQKQQMESRGRPMPPLPPIPGFDPNQ
jgi:hypothetical protein